jgi:hypothetical protein
MFRTKCREEQVPNEMVAIDPEVSAGMRQASLYPPAWIILRFSPGPLSRHRLGELLLSEENAIRRLLNVLRGHFQTGQSGNV